MKSEIVEILMRRDDLTKSEATSVFNHAKELVNNAVSNGGSFDEVEDIMASELGLEMDYIYELL